MVTASCLTTADLNPAAKLITELRTDMNGRKVCTAAEVLEVLSRSVNEPAYTGYIARNPKGKVVGYLGVNCRFAIYAGGAFLQITELFVSPDFRRQGAGRKLITAAEEHARLHGVSSIELGAPPKETHPAAHAFYQSLGYKIVGPRVSKAIPK